MRYLYDAVVAVTHGEVVPDLDALQVLDEASLQVTAT